MAITCLPVTNEKVRAEVWMGDTLIAQTPFVRNFNVQKSRGQVSNTFSVVLEVLAGTQFQQGEKLQIRAGTRGNLKAIFTGSIESTKVSPSIGKPSYYLLTWGGRGVLSELENKTFSRRLQNTGQGMFCLITSGPTNAVDRFYSPDKTVKSGNHTVVYPSPSPSKKKGEHSPLIIHQSDRQRVSEGGEIGRIAEKPSGASDLGTGSGDGFREHTHEDLTEGGPAFGVFSSD